MSLMRMWGQKPHQSSLVHKPSRSVRLVQVNELIARTASLAGGHTVKNCIRADFLLPCFSASEANLVSLAQLAVEPARLSP